MGSSLSRGSSNEESGASKSKSPSSSEMAFIVDKSYRKRFTAETADTARCSSESGDDDDRSAAYSYSSEDGDDDDGSDTFAAHSKRRREGGEVEGYHHDAAQDDVDVDVDNATRDASHDDEDDSAYHSRSDAILVWTSDRTDDGVSQLGASLLRLEGPRKGGPPVDEVVAIKSCDAEEPDDADGSAVSEVAFPGDDRPKRGPDKRSSSGENGEQDRGRGGRPPSTSDRLVDAAEGLRRSKAGLVRALSSVDPEERQRRVKGHRDSTPEELGDAADSLLSEIDALLVQSGALVALKGKDSRMVRRLERCREITLRECEEALERADMFALAIGVRRTRA